ncbi:hypothetical protein BJ165DRAFT_1614018 [Panaeolus papilionaceus]|nr:hypothetical protein BJ165DRAFT_1614018 [Panaeolus papilionaceus]
MAGLSNTLESINLEDPLSVWTERSLLQCATRELAGKPRLDIPANPDSTTFISFADRHVAREHILQNVVHVPSLVNDLRNFAHGELRVFLHKFNAKGKGLRSTPAYGERNRENHRSDATRVSDAYQVSAGNMASEYASKFCIHPKHYAWHGALKFTHLPTSQTFMQETDLTLRTSIRKPFSFQLRPEIIEAIEDPIKMRLAPYGEANIALAIFQFLAEIFEGELIVIDSLSSTDSGFHWSTSKTTNGPCLPRQRQYLSPDSSDTFWSSYQHPGIRERSPHFHKKPRDGGAQKVHLPPRPGNRYSMRRSIAHQFLQRAWSRAVENDATFIVLNCGSKERIGIRDRSSNTLFLSDVIDPFLPGYGAIHIGLHAAIVKDVLSRPPPFRETAHLTRSLIPRPVHRTNLHVSSDNEIQTFSQPDVFNLAIASLPVLLVSLSFAFYQSDAPSAFLREAGSCYPTALDQQFTQAKPNRAYPLKDCIQFVAYIDLGVSHKFAVYRGIATVLTSSGEIRQPAILKLARSADGKRRLLHEYELYKALSKFGVTNGVLVVHGVFQDIESELFALLLQDGGTTLYKREQLRIGGYARVRLFVSLAYCQMILPSEMLKAIVMGINGVRIRHNDIKPDNICINSNGQWFLIDFDLAEFVRYPQEKLWEDIQTIQDIFDRVFIQGDNY